MSQGGGEQVEAATRDLIARGRERGYVTYDEITRTIPPEHVSSDEIEELFARLMELDIAVVDSGEAGGDP